MRNDDRNSGNKFAATYRRSIWVRHPPAKNFDGGDYLEGVYDSPKLLAKALRLMRLMNPNREYLSDDPANP